MGHLKAAVAGMVVLAASAAALELELPVACDMGRVCTIHKYFDHDPGTAMRDFACGRLSSDGHTGTDFRVPDLPTMWVGVPVLAAADGVVVATRDGMEDRIVREGQADRIAGRAAGNGVVLDHGGGWQTQYSHLLRGSVTVATGQSVRAGTPLGLIGLSGMTEFPHVEFSVRRDGQALDPFTGSADATECGATDVSLWAPSARMQLAYRATGVLIAGFSDAAPEAEAMRAGDGLGRQADDPPALVFWVDVFGAEAGDEQRFELTGPDGADLIAQTEKLEASNVSWFAFAGVRRPPLGWAPGWYVGRYALQRDGALVAHRHAAIRLGP